MPPTLHNGRIAEGRALPHENRRHSEWDDHSEAYPYGWDGPQGERIKYVEPVL